MPFFGWLTLHLACRWVRTHARLCTVAGGIAGLVAAVFVVAA